MQRFFDRIIFWLKASRVHSLPMALMSWSVVFCFALEDGGNILNGLLALVGVLFAQLGVNLGDDYVDYISEAGTIQARQKGKCEYILDGSVSINQVLGVVVFYFAAAFVIGLYLTFVCGWQPAAIAFAAGVICLLYPRLTYFGLGELAVGITFAPLLFMGTYFVMCGEFSLVPVLVSVSTGLLTVVLLHVHTLMDYDFDIRENKKTLCAILGSKMKSFYALVIMLILAYANIFALMCSGVLPLKFLITFLTLPMSVGLVVLMKKFVEGDTSILLRKWWMGPIELWEDIEKKNAQNFMIRFYLARNLMGAFSFLVCVAILI